VIYTSGSTGAPKGCMLAHAAVHNRLRWMQDRYRLTERDRVLQKTPYSFDVSVWELFWPLLYGAPVIFAAPGRHTDPRYLVQLIEARGITICHFVPSMLRAFVQVVAPGQCGSLTKIFASGEALPYPLFEDVHAALGAELHNLYGPTEAAVDVTFWHAQPRADRRIPIGRPIANVQIHILDPGLERTPIGVPGELYIGGAGVALGYHARPELTQERFVPDRFSSEPGARLYRTGDLARWRGDGQLQHLGRTDFQVKIRGYRIELGEIEVALARHIQVAEAVVVAQPGPGGEQRLVAYLVARGPVPPAPGLLRDHLRGSLPDYMVPAVFVPLARLPLTPNGKVDRRALPAPELAPAAVDAAFNGPRTPGEQLVATVWRELLGVERIAVADNFLDLGGHSLLIMQAIAKLEARTGKRVSPRTFIFQTLEQIARDYDAPRTTPAPPPRPPTPPPAGRLQRWLSALIPSGKS
jgi:acyl-coenzyme A synthetase/AMP-(fatty) acid ligase